MRFVTLKNEQNNNSKCSHCSAFAFFALLHLFFTSNLVVFVNRGRKIIPCPRAQGTLATSMCEVSLRGNTTKTNMREIKARQNIIIEKLPVAIAR